MSDGNLLWEVGVYYRFPRHDDEICPRDLMEFMYERFRNGKSYGLGRVLIMTRQPIDFYKLLDNWNRKGISGGYLYIGHVQ